MPKVNYIEVIDDKDTDIKVDEAWKEEFLLLVRSYDIAPVASVQPYEVSVVTRSSTKE